MRALLAALLCMMAIPAMAEDRLPGGAYAELAAGMTTFDSTRTVGDVKLIDLGGDAGQGGGRVGYGWTRNALYIGVEADVFGFYGRSRAVVNGQVYSYEPSIMAGGYARLGAVRGASLFYVRAGAQAWDGVGVPAVGVGAEIPFGRFYARIDATYSWNEIERYQGTVALGFRF